MNVVMFVCLLVVDDELDLCIFYELILLCEGYEVDSVGLVVEVFEYL